jgi:hypothetical protein
MSRAPNCIDSQWTGLPLAGFAVLLVATGGENTGRRKPEIHATTFGGEGVLLGKPVGRSDEVSLLPSIFLENPAVGDAVHSPLHMTGMSNTYEATIQAQLVAANGHRCRPQRYGNGGHGTWGTFDARFPYTTATSGTGKVLVFEISPKGGTRINEVDVPLTVAL